MARDAADPATPAAAAETEGPEADAAGPIPLLDLTQQYQGLRRELIEAVTAVLDSQQLINGEAVTAFEQAMASYCGTAEAVGVSSGTDALLMSLMALGIGRGDEVILPGFTFFASAGSVARLGATPVFVDIDPASFNIDPAAAAAAVSPRTRAIMPVHLFGQMAAMGPILDLARQHNLAIVEDAAQALGASQCQCQAGTLGHVGCFSFFPSKNLGGAGDGGMIVTDDSALAQQLRNLRNHGMSAPYQHETVGGNFRLDALQAAYLHVKLPHLASWSQQRRQHAAFYDTQFAQVDAVTPPTVQQGNVSIFNQYVIRASDRDTLKTHLADHQIGSAVYYPKGLHEQPCFAHLGYQRGDLPAVEHACDHVLALPVYPELSAAQRERVDATVR
jgi:dTDP-4-amino-4,6-dideoxygalactose transaminase